MTPVQKLRWLWRSVPRTPQHGGGASVWLFNWWSQRFTASGKALVAIWICLLAVAAVPGWNGAVLPFGLLFFALVLGWISTLGSLSLHAEWHFPQGIQEQSSFKMIVDIHNHSHRDLHDVGAWFFWADEWLKAEGEPLTVDHLAAGGSVQIVVPMRALRRGPHRLRGPVVYRLDATGLFRRCKRIAQHTIVLVRPRPFCPELQSFLVSGIQGAEFARLIVPQLQRSMEFLGVREFRDGDEVRDIHHKTWARLGKPYTKEFGRERGAGVVLVVESGCMDYMERSHVDPMLRLAAGVALWLMERGILGRFILDGREYELPQGNALRDVVLDALASVPVPQWWKWPKPMAFAPSARALGPVLAIGCSRHWVEKAEAFQGGIVKRILVSIDSPNIQAPDQLLWIAAKEDA